MSVKLEIPERESRINNADRAGRSQHGRDHARCSAVPDRLSLRLHGTDDEPFPARRHHRKTLRDLGTQT